MAKIIFDKRTKYITRSAVIAALYVALTAVSAAFGLSSEAVQIRISEALCVLPVFSSSAIPGVAIGCMISNLIFGASLPEICVFLFYMTYSKNSKNLP